MCVCSCQMCFGLSENVQRAHNLTVQICVLFSALTDIQIKHLEVNRNECFGLESSIKIVSCGENAT